MNKHHLLQPFLLPQRLERLKEVLARRTVSVTLVLENLHKDYNISAILRTCESFGIQHVHVVPQPGEGKVYKTVTQGSHKWLTVHRHDDVSSCLRALKDQGFRIFAGAFGKDAVSLEEADFSGKVALVFSNELDGADEALLDQVDGFFIIPMSGFSQSLNVSVAAGIVLHRVLQYKRETGEELEPVSPGEAAALMEEWVRKSVRNADEVLAELRSRK